ncbi:hypothetical protein CS0771_56810 [Catellatospora sp. IY07-71]|nr:hypothetical protein CS0771_56810 [Catellatospora sp. IY07-71]
MAAVAATFASVATVLQWLESRPDRGADPVPTVTVANDDARLEVDQCVRNLGDAETPLIKIDECGPGTMRIMARIEQPADHPSDADTAAEAACQEKAPGYTDYHFSTAPPEPGVSVVFCLQSL